jgi:hypothetical protein
MFNNSHVGRSIWRLPGTTIALFMVVFVSLTSIRFGIPLTAPITVPRGKHDRRSSAFQIRLAPHWSRKKNDTNTFVLTDASSRKELAQMEVYVIEPAPPSLIPEFKYSISNYIKSAKKKGRRKIFVRIRSGCFSGGMIGILLGLGTEENSTAYLIHKSSMILLEAHYHKVVDRRITSDQERDLISMAKSIRILPHSTGKPK